MKSPGTRSGASSSRNLDSSNSPRITRELFDKEYLDEFWKFVQKRQTIYHRRFEENKPAPWTEDQILQHYRFTNVYRELDPGTKYAMGAILERDAPEADRIFNIMIYRVIGKEETHAELGFQFLSEFNSKDFERQLKHIRDELKKPPFTGAYTVSPYMKMGSHDKIENVSRLFRNLCKTFGRFYDRLMRSTSAREAYEVISSANGFGTFLAFQVLVDLTYPVERAKGAKILPFSQDDWAIAGPGARAGINLLLRAPQATDDLDVMRWLWENQEKEFSRLKLHFPHIQRHGIAVPISLSNIENCLCEYNKYMNVKTGRGRVRRRFVPKQSFPIDASNPQSSLGSYQS